MIERYVLIRSIGAGIFAGDLVSQDNFNQRVVLRNAIRLWYWEGACSLSQIAEEGVKKPENCKFAVPVTEIEVFEVVEIMSITPAAEHSIKSVPPWRVADIGHGSGDNIGSGDECGTGSSYSDYFDDEDDDDSDDSGYGIGEGDGGRDDDGTGY